MTSTIIAVDQGAPVDGGGIQVDDQGVADQGLSDQGVFPGGAFGASGGSLSQQVPIGVLKDQVDPHGHYPLVMGRTFPRRAWDPGVYAQAVLAEFAVSGWIDELALPPPPTDQLEVAQEIKTLIKKAQLRQARAAEILAQAADASVYWSDALMMTSHSHPATWDLIIVANTVGHMVGMHFKRKFNRARPVEVYPALMPPILTPGHPSYPNAHALESGLILACLKLAIPPLGNPRERSGPLDDLASRIGENREVAGLHFPSDTKASIELVPKLVPFLQTSTLFNEIVGLAAAEWDGVFVLPLA